MITEPERSEAVIPIPALIASLIAIPQDGGALKVPKNWKADDGTATTVVAPHGSPIEQTVRLLEEVDPLGPGMAVLVMRDGEVILSRAVGMADIEAGTRVTPRTRFDVASIAKMFTALSILRLATEGLIDLDDRVQDYLPELRFPQDVALRQLIHHTGGIEDDHGTLNLAGFEMSDDVRTADIRRILFHQSHLRFRPGHDHFYSNGGYTLLAAVVERVTGESFRTWTRSNLFAPLGMSDTDFIDDPNELVANRARPYVSRDDGSIALGRYPRFVGPGGLVTTTSDLARFAKHLSAAASRDEEWVDTYLTPGRVTGGRQLDYAFGLSRKDTHGLREYQHGGSAPGVRSTFRWFPDQDLVIIAISNGGEGLSPWDVSEQIVESQLGEFFEASLDDGPRMMMIPEHVERPAISIGVTVDPGRIATYVGTYEMEDGLLLSIGVDGSRLLLGFNGETPQIELFPIPKGRFIMPPMNYEFSFRVDEITMHITEGSIRRSEPHDIVGRRLVARQFDVENSAEYVGTYFSEELDAFYRVTFDDGVLHLRHARHGDLPLRPLRADEFDIDSRVITQVTFLRDGDVVTGANLTAYSWGATAEFTKVE